MRNPRDRLLSSYTYLTTSPDRTLADIRFGNTQLAQFRSVEQFVLALRSPLTRMVLRERAHFRRQCSFICLPAAVVPAMGSVGRYDNLAEDSERLMVLLQRPEARLPHARSPGHQGYRDAYSTRMREVVGAAYGQDIAVLRYRF